MHEGFQSPLSPDPIRYAYRWQRDALIALALHPRIIAIEGARLVGSDLCLVARFLDAVVSMRVADVDPNDPSDSTVTWSRRRILGDPGLPSRRAVWAARDQPVAIVDRVRILAGTPPSGISLIDLTSAEAGLITAVSTLLCERAVTADLSSGLLPETVIHRSRSSGDLTLGRVSESRRNGLEMRAQNR